MKKYDMTNMFRTGKALQYFLDNPEYFEGGETWIDAYIVNCHIVPVCEMIGYDSSCLDYYLQGQIDFDPEKIDFGYETGYWWSTEQGEIRILHPDYCNELSQSVKARFLTTFPLSEEMELQADNGEFAYYYIGANFLTVWETMEG